MIRLKRLFVHNFKQLQEVELHLPEQARVLVQGKNEAGKSTLFEALYFALFGNALVTEGGTRNLDDLIRYGVEKARVELDLQVNTRLFQIRRTITRGKSNVWELDIWSGDAVDEIRGNIAVNKRLVAELGFDGDALLNTCFVEQKKLDKLEGLSRAKREESLAKLLNLDALVRIENDLKLHVEDKQELERLKKRADLAAIQAELPSLQQQLAHIESQLRWLDLRRVVQGALNETRALQQLEAHIHTLGAQRDEISQRVERIEALRQAMQYVKEALNNVERALETTRTIEQATRQLQDAQRAADALAPLQARLIALHRLSQRLARLQQIATARERYAQRAAQLQQAQARLTELNATIAREQTELEHIEAQIHQAEIDAALKNWLAVRREIAPTEDITRRVQAQHATREQLACRLRTQVYGSATALIAIVAIVVTTAILAFALVAPNSMALALLLALGVSGLAALVVIVMVARVLQSWYALARASEEVGRVEGELRAQASLSEAQRARVHDAEARLAQLNVPVPDSLEHAERELAAREPLALDALLAAREDIRARLLRAHTSRDEVQKQYGVADDAQLQTERAHSERAAQKAERLYTAWTARTQTTADALEIALDAPTVQRAYYDTRAQIEHTRQRAQESTRLQQDIAQREHQRQELLARARTAYDLARAIQPDVPEWNAQWESEDYTRIGKRLRAEYDALGGEHAIKQVRELEGELGKKQGEHATRARNAALLVAQARETLAALGQSHALGDTPTLDELETLMNRLQSLELGDEATLRAQQRELVGRVHALRDRQTQLERELGLTNVTLDPATCRAEWEARMREMLIRERSVEIASLARKRIMQKVLPTTLDYFRRILPTLTRDRYHDAQLDPETYRIQVWDERAGDGGAFKEKNIFSGGTKDQFSLALRLAFALATLPQERGAAPSFIFLDEPLGSFDDERADALIQLLTEGEIARAFDQIFLISHVHVNERLFTHHVVLENGRVVETNLK